MGGAHTRDDIHPKGNCKSTLDSTSGMVRSEGKTGALGCMLCESGYLTSETCMRKLEIAVEHRQKSTMAYRTRIIEPMPAVARKR